MATGGLYGQSSAGIVSPQSGSESSGLYGNTTVFGGTYFEWFIFQVSETQPATPTGGSWSFTTNVGTPPSGWLASPPAAPTNTVWVSVGLVNSKSNAAISWSTPGKFSFSSGLPILSGSAAPSPGDGQTDQLYIETGTTPETIWFKQVGTWTRLTGLNLYVDLVSNQTVGGTKTFSSQIQGSISGNSANVTGVVALANGGTGATNASGARTALELGTIAIQNANLVSISGGAITGITDLAIADGGTGASTAADARTNLGLGSAAVLTAGAALGVATLDAGGTVPLSQIPASIQGGVSYQGTWNATTNSPTLTSSVGSKGYYYVVSTAGSTNLNGITDWKIGDWAIFNGTAWEKIDNTEAVTSVNGYTGTVVLGSMSNQAASNVAITGGAIDGTTIGATTASSGKFTTGLVGANANFTDFPNAQLVGSQANTGSGHIYNIGVAGEGVATDVVGAGQWGVGVYGTGATAGATRGIGVVGDGHVSNTADTAAAIGVRGYATQTHSGGQNIGFYAQATGGASNYALFMASGNIYSAVVQTWAILDNTANALSFDTTGKTGVLAITTTDGSEAVTMSGGLSVAADSSFTSTGAVKLSSGTTGQRPTGAAGKLRFNTTTAEFEGYNGTAWASVGGSAISNDTSTASNLYPLFAAATTGTASSVYTSNAQYLFKPSTGELSVKAPIAANGILINSDQVTSSYTIASGTNGFSVGPLTIASGATVTVASGQRHVVI